MNEIVKDPARCQGIVRSTGKQCGKYPVAGTSVCIKHGANTPRTRASAAAVVAEQREHLARVVVPKAVKALEKIVADPKASDSDRIRAANSILDRTGLVTGNNLTVTHETQLPPDEMILAAAAGVRERLAAFGILPELPDPNVVDAELVEEDSSEVEQAEVVPFRPPYI